MAFAGAGLADQVHDLVAIDEVELGECEDAVAVERGRGWLKVPPAQPVE